MVKAETSPKIDLIYSPIVNYAIQQNRVPVVRSLVIQNNQNEELSNIEIEIVHFSESPVNFFQPEGYERLCGNVLKPDLEHADCNSPFYAKKVVFTGVLKSIARKDAAELIQKMGADIDTTITKRTNFVISGSAPGPSKMKIIEQLMAQGCDIRLVYEEEFLRMCNGFRNFLVNFL